MGCRRRASTRRPLGSSRRRGAASRSSVRRRKLASLSWTPWPLFTGPAEIDRALVRDFLSAWDAWAREQKCAVLLLAHQSPYPRCYRLARAQIGKRARGPSGRWERSRCAAPRNKHKGAERSFAEKCGSGAATGPSQSQLRRHGRRRQALAGRMGLQGGRTLRLTIRGRWLEKPQGGRL